MENIVRDIDLVQRYLEKSLTEAEKQEMDYRLQEETSLQNLYREHQKLIAGIKYAHLENKLTQLRSLEAVLPLNTEYHSPIRKTLWLPMSIAASVLIMLGVWFFTIRDTRPFNEQLFASNFEAFDSPGSGLTRSNDNAVTLKAKAYDAYDAGRYEDASVLFEQALKEKDDAIMHLCLGNTYLVMNEPQKAEKTLQYIRDEHVDLVTPATWYLALAYLKQNKMEKTKATLWEISKSSTYGEKARKLLLDLD